MKAEKGNIVLEFQINDTAEEAFEQVEEYRKDFFNNGTDVFCIGINYQYKTMPVQNQLVCNWVANLYHENGTLRQYFPAQKEVLHCDKKWQYYLYF